MTIGQGVEIGPFHFTVIRILVAVGVVRIIVRREWLAGGMNPLDWLMVVWAVWAIISSAFHNSEDIGLVFRLGLVYNAGGIYFMLRVFCSSIADLVRLCRIIAIVLAAVAIEMIYEQVAFHNLFSVFGGVPETPALREGKIRAFGPFTHPILAGTVGAVTLPLMIGLRRHHPTTAFLGALVSMTIVMSSGSSGPMASALVAIVALCLWPQRFQMRYFRWGAVFIYILLNMVMKVPAYYLIGRIDIAGGSTGWHRAHLIDMALTHIGEWWATGTDHTRHWMPTGVSWNENHTDITNHYIYMGVLGGLLLMFLFIAVLAKGFSFIGNRLRLEKEPSQADAFLLWALGCALFAHAASCISVSYFDQSVVFLYITLAAIGSMRAGSRTTAGEVQVRRARADGHLRGPRHRIALG